MTFPADSPLVDDLHPSSNLERRKGDVRPYLLILHYTGVETCAKAIDWLSVSESRVSCHYVVDEDGRVTQMVPESMRAWHAGLSSWAGEIDINSASIGIEIHNPGHEAGYPEFPEKQMSAVMALCQDIIARYGILPEHVLAHSDIAPVRKKDPGEKFDWERLAAAGIGHWVEPLPPAAEDQGLGPSDEGPLVAEAQSLLKSYGYGIEPSGVHDTLTGFVVTAFQRHFRRARVDGRIDRSTVDTLKRLVAAMPSKAVG